MEYELSLNVYEMNQATIYAVQGESDSRTVICSLIEKSGVVIPTSNAEIINKMLDLTDFTARLYAVRSDGVVPSVEGTITDAENGVVSFELSEEFTEISGLFDCAVVLTKSGGVDLRIVGISLQVAALSIESTTNITVPSGTTKEICVTVYSEYNTVYELQSGDKLIFGVKKSLTDENYLIQKFATSSNKDDNGYKFTLSPEDTANLSGSYLYEVGLQTASGEYYIVVECSDFTVTSTLTHKE